jgi:MFS family permease
MALAERMRSYADRTGYGRVIRHRDLRLLLGGLLVSASGTWAYNVAVLAFVYERTGSLTWVSAAGLVRFLPMLLAGPYAGVLAERIERVRLMVSSDLVCCASQIGLAMVAVLDGPVEVALVLAALTAVANSVYFPAVTAMIPQLAGEEDLAAANALNATIDNLVVIVGPALGAAMLALGSPALAFALDSLSFALSALLVIRIRTRSSPSDVTEGGEAGLLRQMAVGIRTILSSGSVAWLVGFCAVASFVYGTDVVLFVEVSRAKLGTGAEGFGYLLVGLGAGGVLAATVIDRLAKSGRLGAAVVVGMCAFCLPTALLTVVHEPGVAFALQIVRGAGTLVVDVLAVTALQRALAPNLVARVFGVFDAVTIGSIAIGTLIAPPLVDGLGLDGSLIILGFLFPALALATYPTLARLDRRGQARLAGLAPRMTALEQVAIFGPASRAVLERLAAEAKEVTAYPGTTIVREGEPANAFYVLVDGSVEVTAVGEAGGPAQRIRTLSPVSAFGEIGLIEETPRTATVSALGRCRLYRIAGDAFLEALASTPPTGSFIETARGRLTRTHPSRSPAHTPPGM